MNKLKSGTYITFNGLQYLFLGYSNYKRTMCVVADFYGNKANIYVNEIQDYYI